MTPLYNTIPRPHPKPIYRYGLLLISEMKASSALSVLMVLALVLGTSGCIDVKFAKDILVKPKSVSEVYEWNRPCPPLSHNFTTNLSSPLAEARYTHTQGFDVKPKTMTLKISIKVNIFKLNPGEVPQLPGPIGDIIRNLTENISEYLRNAERHVDITLKSPEGQIAFTKKYNESADESRRIEKPIPGTWSIKVDATGIGLSETYKDYFRIELTSLEYRGTKEV